MSDLPASKITIQTEQVLFRSPVSESLMQDMGASLNFATQKVLPVSAIFEAIGTEADIQSLMGSTDWILADGRAVPGSTYEALFGATVPDLRGKFRRGKNNGGSGAGFNPDGDVPVGTYQGSANLSHYHPGSKATWWISFPFSPTTYPENSTNDPGLHHNVPAVEHGDIIDFHIEPDGISESRPINITVNVFIRIN